jgi:hypothetical protein
MVGSARPWSRLLALFCWNWPRTVASVAAATTRSDASRRIVGAALIPVETIKMSFYLFYIIFIFLFLF